MTFKDDIRNKTGAFLTKSQEIFENLFKQATQELRIKRKPKPAVQKPLTVPALRMPRPKKETSELAKKPEKIVSPPKPPDKVKAAPPVKTKPAPTARAGKGFRVLRVSLLIALLLIFTGFLANYFAIFDFTAIPDLLGLGPKQVFQAPVPRKQAAKPPEKPATSPKPSQPPEKVSSPPPAPVDTTPSNLSKEEKLAELETP